ncbi:Thymidylate kinase [Scale drop disease virus]|nr:Thymidylate kinase [Scale drop disease virus]
MGRGILISIEGIEKSGKSTQAIKLTAALKRLGHNVETVIIPMQILPLSANDRHVQMTVACNILAEQDQMKERLMSGESLVIDQYLFTSMAKSNEFDWVKGLYSNVIIPDLVIFLDTSLEETYKRGRVVCQRQQQNRFKEMIWNDLNHGFWKIVQGDESKNTIHSTVLRFALETIYSTHKEKPLNQFW